MTDVIARRLIIHGRVQGVFYRDWTVDAARTLGLTGWVRNRMDGTVEVHAQGSAGAVAALIDQARTGPSAAVVSDIDVEEVGVEALPDFGRRPTA